MSKDTKKLLNIVKERGKYWNVFGDGYMFNDEWFYPSRFIIFPIKKKNSWLGGF
jgi:hypothetical protein